MENYTLKTYLPAKPMGDKHMLTNQGVWGVLFTLQTLECPRSALEKHFNLFQLHVSILKNKCLWLSHFLDMMLLLCLSFSCICDNNLPKAKKAKCTSLWSPSSCWKFIENFWALLSWYLWPTKENLLPCINIKYPPQEMKCEWMLRVLQGD